MPVPSPSRRRPVRPATDSCVAPLHQRLRLFDFHWKCDPVSLAERRGYPVSWERRTRWLLLIPAPNTRTSESALGTCEQVEVARPLLFIHDAPPPGTAVWLAL